MAWDNRVLTPADQPAWRALRLEALDAFPFAFLTTVEEQRTRAASEDRKFLANGNWRGLFSSADDLIGMAALIPFSATAARHRMQLGAVYISQPHWGSGAAQKLVDDVEAEAKRKGALQLELSVSSENPRAIRFYERNGFERVGVEPRAIIVDGRGVDDFAYVKFLDT